jgi:hypothetical protein
MYNSLYDPFSPQYRRDCYENDFHVQVTFRALYKQAILSASERQKARKSAAKESDAFVRAHCIGGVCRDPEWGDKGLDYLKRLSTGQVTMVTPAALVVEFTPIESTQADLDDQAVLDFHMGLPVEKKKKIKKALRKACQRRRKHVFTKKH